MKIHKMSMTLIGMTVLVMMFSSCLPANEPYSVHDVWRLKNTLVDTEISVLGFSGFGVTRELENCPDDPCCNDAWLSDFFGGFYLFDNENQFEDKVIEIHGVICNGNECEVDCEPINPQKPEQLLLVGTLGINEKNSTYRHLFLYDVQWEKSQQLIDGVWQPIEEGFYTVVVKTPEK